MVYEGFVESLSTGCELNGFERFDLDDQRQVSTARGPQIENAPRVEAGVGIRLGLEDLYLQVVKRLEIRLFTHVDAPGPIHRPSARR